MTVVWFYLGGVGDCCGPGDVGVQTSFNTYLCPFCFQGSLSTRIFNQVRLPDTHLKSWRNGQCEVCSTNLDQLKGEAVAMVHTLEESQFLAYYNIPGYMVGPNADQLIRRADKCRQLGSGTVEPVERGLGRHEEVPSGSFLSR